MTRMTNENFKMTNVFFILSLITLVFMIATATREIEATLSVKMEKNGRRPADKNKCNKRELSLRDCELVVGKTKLNLLKERWRFEDGLWLAVNDLPVKGDTIQWDQIRLDQYAERRILQLWLWSRSEGEAEVQTLNWYVIELGEQESPVRVHEVVQRRRLGARVTDSTRIPATKAAIYIYDPRDKTNLKPAKEKLMWSAGRRHGEF